MHRRNTLHRGQPTTRRPQGGVLITAICARVDPAVLKYQRGSKNFRSLVAGRLKGRV
jgi:hypothetical protein